MEFVNQNGLKLSIACTLAAVALVLIVRLIAGADVPSPSAASVRHSEGVQNRKLGGTQNKSNLSMLRKDQLNISEDTEYAGSGRNIFRLKIPVSWTPPRPKPSPPAPDKQPPPSMATLPLKFFGFAITSSHGKQVFLSEDGDVFIGREGDIVNRRYKILQVRPASVEIEDLVDQVQQLVPLDPGMN